MKYFFSIILFNLLIVCNTDGQTLCDGTLPDSTTNIFTIVEQMPEPSLTENQLEEILNSSIDLKQYNIEDGTNIYLSFIVNCEGKDFNYKVLRPINELFENKLITVIESSVNWTNGKQRNKAVDVIFNQVLIVDNGLLNVLDKEELDEKYNGKKKRKRKRKRKK